MRALLLTGFDGPEALRVGDVPEPVPDSETVLLEVEAIGINFPDLLATKGQYQHKVELPFVPGCEVAGVVLDAPPDSGWSSGDRAAAFVWQGGFAERVKVPLNALAALPADADAETGAAMVVNYQTVYFALSRRGGLGAGETLLVLGAGGGIGTAAIQVGIGLGARVIAGVADESQVAVARAAGADDTVVLGEGFAGPVRELTAGRGVDVVLDPLGDWLFTEATRALAPEGRILVVGFAAGEIPMLRVNRLLLKNIAAVGVAFGAFLDVDPTVIDAGARALSEMFAKGVVRPQIGARYAFEEIPRALADLEAQRIRGKAVASAPSPMRQGAG